MLQFKEVDQNLSDEDIEKQIRNECQKIDALFSTFKKHLEKDVNKGKDHIIQNACYQLQAANRIIKYLNSWSNFFASGGSYYESMHNQLMSCCHGISDPLIYSNACAIMAYATLRYNHNFISQSDSAGKILARELFSQAVDTIAQTNHRYHTVIQSLLPDKQQPTHLVKQLANKMAVLRLQSSNYQEQIEAINCSIKFIQLQKEGTGEAEIHNIVLPDGRRDLLQSINAAKGNLSLTFHDLRFIRESVGAVRRAEPEQVITLFEKYGSRESLATMELLFSNVDHTQRTSFVEATQSIFTGSEAKPFSSRIEVLTAEKVRKLTDNFNQQLSFILELNISHVLFVANFVDVLKQKFLHEKNICIDEIPGDEFTRLSITFSNINNIKDYKGIIDSIYTICDQKCQREASEIKTSLFSHTDSSTLYFPNLGAAELVTLFEKSELEPLKLNFCLKTTDFSLGKKVLASMQENYTKDNVLRITCSPAIANSVINELKLTEESFKCVSAKPIAQLLIPNEYRDALAQSSANGGHYLFSLTERKPFPIFTMLLVGGIAAVEMAVGIALVTCLAPTAYGALVGIGLITDAAMEVFTLSQTAYNRQLNMKYYLVAKGVSIGLIFATAGISQAIAAKRAAQAARAAAKAAETSTDIAQATSQQVAARSVESATTHTAMSTVQRSSNASTLISQELARKLVPKAAALSVSVAADMLIPQKLKSMQGQLKNSIDKQYARFIVTHKEKMVRIFSMASEVGESELQALTTRLLGEIISTIHFSSADSIHGHVEMFTQNMQEQSSVLLSTKIPFIINDYFKDCTFQKVFPKYLDCISVPYQQEDIQEVNNVLMKNQLIQESGHIAHAISLENLSNVNFGKLNVSTHDFFRNLFSEKNNYYEQFDYLQKNVQQALLTRAMALLERKYDYLKAAAATTASAAAAAGFDFSIPKISESLDIVTASVTHLAIHKLVSFAITQVEPYFGPTPEASSIYTQIHIPASINSLLNHENSPIYSPMPVSLSPAQAQEMVGYLFGPALNTLPTPHTLTTIYQFPFNTLFRYEQLKALFNEAFSLYKLNKRDNSNIIETILTSIKVSINAAKFACVHYIILKNFLIYIVSRINLNLINDTDYYLQSFQMSTELKSTLRLYNNNLTFWKFISLRANNIPEIFALFRDCPDLITDTQALLFDDKTARLLRAVLMNNNSITLIKNILDQVTSPTMNSSILITNFVGLLLQEQHVAAIETASAAEISILDELSRYITEHQEHIIDYLVKAEGELSPQGNKQAPKLYEIRLLTVLDCAKIFLGQENLPLIKEVLKAAANKNYYVLANTIIDLLCKPEVRSTINAKRDALIILLYDYLTNAVTNTDTKLDYYPLLLEKVKAAIPTTTENSECIVNTAETSFLSRLLSLYASAETDQVKPFISNLMRYNTTGQIVPLLNDISQFLCIQNNILPEDARLLAELAQILIIYESAIGLKGYNIDITPLLSTALQYIQPVARLVSIQTLPFLAMIALLVTPAIWPCFLASSYIAKAIVNSFIYYPQLSQAALLALGSFTLLSYKILCSLANEYLLDAAKQCIVLNLITKTKEKNDFHADVIKQIENKDFYLRYKGRLFDAIRIYPKEPANELNLSNRVFENISFTNSTIRDVNFSDSKFINVSFINTKFEGQVTFDRARIDAFTLASLANSIRFSKQRITLNQCIITGDLSKLNLADISFSCADLTEVTSMYKTNIHGTNLDHVKFSQNDGNGERLLVSAKHFKHAISINKQRSLFVDLITKSIDAVYEHLVFTEHNSCMDSLRKMQYSLESILKSKEINGDYLLELLSSCIEDISENKLPLNGVYQQSIQHTDQYLGKGSRLLWLIFYYREHAEWIGRALIMERISDKVLRCLFDKGENRGQDGLKVKATIHQALQHALEICSTITINQENIETLEKAIERKFNEKFCESKNRNFIGNISFFCSTERAAYSSFLSKNTQNELKIKISEEIRSLCLTHADGYGLAI